MIKNNAAPSATAILMPSDCEFHQSENAKRMTYCFYVKGFKIILFYINESFLSSKFLICITICSTDVKVIPSS